MDPFFDIITQKAIRHNSFSRVGERIREISDFAEHYNSQACPFVWVATAEPTLAKIQHFGKLSPGRYISHKTCQKRRAAGAVEQQSSIL